MLAAGGEPAFLGRQEGSQLWDGLWPKGRKQCLPCAWVGQAKVETWCEETEQIWPDARGDESDHKGPVCHSLHQLMRPL